MDADIIVALISLAAGLGGVYVGGWMQRRKTDAEAAKSAAEANDVVRETVMKLIEPLNKRIEQLESQVKVLTAENTKLRRWAERLICQVKELGGIPASLDEDDEDKET